MENNTENIVPKVSVCIPAYNEEESIIKCLNSVSNQTDIKIDEILVGTNSSIDRTNELVNKYAKMDSRVKVVASLKGKANAWNALNEEAKNFLRIFIDGDCIATEGSFSRLCKELQEGDYDIVGASIERDIKGKSLLLKVINFPKKYLMANTVLNGGLYLMNWGRIKANLKNKLNVEMMPDKLINDDAFLQLISREVKVSSDVFVIVKTADTLDEEICRFKRMALGRVQLKSLYYELLNDDYKRMYIERYSRSRKKNYCLLFKHCSMIEKFVFPIMMFSKYFVFKYIHSVANRERNIDEVSWK